MEGPYFVAAVVPSPDDACPRAAEAPSDDAYRRAVPCLGPGIRPGPGVAEVLSIPTCAEGAALDRAEAYAVAARQSWLVAADRATGVPGTVARR